MKNEDSISIPVSIVVIDQTVMIFQLIRSFWEFFFVDGDVERKGKLTFN